MPRGVALLAALALLAGGATLHAATADPLLGSWRVTAGGSGTLVVQETSSFFRLIAGTGGVSLGCVDGGDGDVVGFVELPGNTALPAGRYNATIGFPGQGCSYSTQLQLNGDRLNATVTHSENGQPGGPFAFARVGAGPTATKGYAWSVKAKATRVLIKGSGRVSADAKGKVLGASGRLAATQGSSRWVMTVDPPGTVRRGKNGAFTLTLTVNVTSGNCLDPSGTLVVTKGKAAVHGICSAPEIAGKGTTTLR